MSPMMKNLIENIRNEIASELVSNFVKAMNNIGICGEEIKQYMINEGNG